jgi:PAS domain S-box-containing protein
MECQNLQSMIQSSPFGFAYHRIITDAAGNAVDYEFLDMNPAFEALTALARETTLHKSVRAAIPGIERDQFDWIGFYGKIALQGGNQIFEQYSEPLARWYQVQAYSPGDGFFTTLFIDITERKQIEAALRDQKDYNESLLAAIPDLMFVLNRDGVFIDLKAGHSEELYMPKELFMGKKVTDVLPLPLASAINQGVAQTLAGQYTAPIEYQLPLQNGIGDFEARITLLGKDHVIVIVQNVCERKRMEAQLRHSEYNFRSLFETMDDMVFIASKQGEILYVNPSATRKLGYSLQELSEMHILDVHPQDQRLEAERICSEMLSGARSFCPLPLAHKDGMLLPVETRTWFGLWSGIDCIFGISKDLSKEQEALQKFNKIFQNNPAPMAISSLPDRKFSDVNEAFVKTFGYAKEHVLGKTVAELQLFVEKAKPEEMNRQLEERGCIRNAELKARSASGDIVVGLFSEEIIASQGQQYSLMVMMDISAQKKAQEEAQALLEKMTLAADAAGFGVWVWNMEQSHLEWDRWMFKLYGIQPEAFDGTNEAWQQAVHPEDLARCNEKVAQVLQEGDSYDSEFRIVTPEGEIRHLRSKALVKRAAQGQPLKMVGINYDITELVRQNDLQTILMKIAAQYINMPLEHVDTAIQDSLRELGRFTGADRAYVFDYDWNRDVCNNTFEWCEDGIETQLATLQNISNSEISQWVNAHRQGLPIYVADVDALRADDGVREMLEPQGVKSVIAIPMMQGTECVGFIGFDSVKTHHTYSEKEKILLTLFAQMLVNVNMRRDMQLELIASQKAAESASKAKSEFLANMSHEIRTPLSGVIGFTELILQTPLTEIQRQYIQNANVAGSALLGIINDILDFSKIEAGKLELDITRTDLVDVLEQSTDILRFQARQKGLQLSLDIQADTPRWALVDAMRLKQICINLMSNAVKFTEKGIVELQLKFADMGNHRGRYTISVQDSGIGIMEAQKEKLFKAFSQADSSTTRKFGGTGLGLVISNLLAEKMGSRIELESEYGKGARFFFSIEAEYDSREAEKPSEGPGGFVDKEYEMASNASTLLIAEDVEMNMLLIKAIVGRLFPALRILEAKNGLQAVDMIKQYKVDLVLMDVQMPELDGVEATQRIRAYEQNTQHRTPIVALTAGAFQDEKDRVLAAGMDGFLAKPIESAKLREIMQSFLPASAAPKHDIEAHYQKSILLESFGHDARFLAKVTASCRRDGATAIADLGQAVANADYPFVYKTAHRLKGLAANMRLPLLTELAGKMERCGAEMDGAQIQQALGDIRTEWETLSGML